MIKQSIFWTVADWGGWRWVRKLPEYILLGITLGLAILGAIKIVVALVALMIGVLSLVVKNKQWWRW